MENGHIRHNPSGIRTAAAVLEKRRPAYTALLAFYGALFEKQEIRSEKVRTDGLPLDPRRIEIQRQEGFPLLSTADFPLDVEAGRELLIEMCGMARDGGRELADAGKAIEAAIGDETAAGGALIASVIEPAGDRLLQYAQTMGVAPQMLATFCYHAIRPSLIAWARALADKPGVSKSWDQGICPICGSPPALSLLKDEGQRTLVCGFCWHEWRLRRTVCPICRAAGKHLRYFFDEAEPECRVDLCDACKGYVKTVDTRKADRPVYPPLEALTTLHLDLKAKELLSR